MSIEESFINPIDFLKEEGFVKSCRTRTVSEEEIIISQGSNSSDMFVIKSGRFVVSDSKGEEFVFAALTEGDVFGEMSFFRSSARSATVTCIVPGELLVFSRNAFSELYERDPQLAVRIVFTLAVMLSDRLLHADTTLSLLSDDSELRQRYEIRRLMKELRGSISKFPQKESLPD